MRLRHVAFQASANDHQTKADEANHTTNVNAGAEFVDTQLSSNILNFSTQINTNSIACPSKPLRVLKEFSVLD